MLIALLCQLALAQVPYASAPPLEPAEASADVPVPTSPPLTPALTEDAATEDRPPAPRGKRIAGTVIGALVGDSLTSGIYVLQAGFVVLQCIQRPAGCVSVPLLAAMAVATSATFGPLGPLVGNRVAGGRAPYWKFLVGTAVGLALSAIVGGLFAASGSFGGPNSNLTIAELGISALPTVIAQTVVSELGEPDPP